MENAKREMLVREVRNILLSAYPQLVSSGEKEWEQEMDLDEVARQIVDTIGS